MLYDGKIRGRGATLNPSNRFDLESVQPFDDGWFELGDERAHASPPRTRVVAERARTIISTNSSPDVGFHRSINPYKGCEHGCIYCYARPTHAYLGMSPGLDFETQIISKPNAGRLLRRRLSSRNYQPATIVIGTNTDPYQPTEREHRITRQVIEVLTEFRHPFSVITKSQGILRDLDLLAPAGRAGRCQVMVSITTLDPQLGRVMEPRATHPKGRLRTIDKLVAAGVPVGVMAAPMIPAINDMELEKILAAAASAGADRAGYVAVRLPLEIKELFEGWLDTHFADRKKKVLSLIRSMHGGKLYQAGFSTRMRGTGTYALLLNTRFRAAVNRLGLNTELAPLDATQFGVPLRSGDQMTLV